MPGFFLPTKIENMESIIEIITELFVATDQQKWNKVQNCFSQQVEEVCGL